MVLFYLFVLVLPLYRHRFMIMTLTEVGKGTVFKFIGVACVLYALFYAVTRGQMAPLLRTWQVRLFLLLYAIAAISQVTSRPMTPDAISSYTSLLFLLVSVVVLVDSQKRFRATMLVAVGSIGLTSVVLVREWLIYHGGSVSFRPGYVAGDSNKFTIGALACMPFALCVLLDQGPRWRRWFCGVCLLLAMIATTLAASRSGLLGLAATCLYMLLRLRRRVRYLVFVSAVVVPVTLFFSSSPLWRLVQPGYGDRVSEELRLLAWSAGLQMIREHPLVGVGLGNFKPLMGQYMDPGMRFDLLPDAAEFRSIAHNGYIGVAAELGLPALLVYLAILVFSYRTLERVRKDTERAGPRLIYQTALGIQAGLIGTGVANFFLSGENHRVLWLMIFMSSVVPGVLRKIRMNTRKTASLGSPRMQPS